MAAVTAAGPVVLTWEPSSQPRRAYQTSGPAEPCPVCTMPLHADPRGIWRACLACRRRVTPAAVKAPYDRGQTAAQRQVKSRAERDLEALALEDRKGPMLDQLDTLAADGRLDTASIRKIRQFRQWVEAAESEARLDELIELFRQAGPRPRRWWHGRPVAELEGAEAGPDDDDGHAGEIGEGALAVVPGAAVDYVAELAARDWVLQPHRPGICHVVQLSPHGQAGAEPEQCLRRASRVIAGGAVCESCYQALTAPLGRRPA